MKKTLSLLLVLALSICLLAGCSDKSGDDNETTATPTTNSGNEATEAPSTAQLYSEVVSVPSDLLASEAPATDTLGVPITDDMRTAGIINQNNITRLANAMVKAANGEEVTIAYLGGSITDGSLASPQETKCYAYLSTQWWINTFPKATINYVNAGIGATDSYLGVHRVQKDVLDYNPDVVIVEFSVNDYNSINQETYESLLRRILNYESEPAVISLYLTQENGSDYQSKHQVVSFSLEVPMISYRNAIYPSIEAGTLTWDQVGAPDGTHPNNGGHAVIANLLTNFYRTVIEQIPTMEYKPYTISTSYTTKSRYENACMYDNTSITPSASESFDATTIGAAQFKNGWQTTTGGTISFEVTAANIGVVFFGTQDGLSGQFEVYVDDELTATIDANFIGKWGSYADYQELVKFDEAGTHTIRIQPSANTEGQKFTILALTLS